MFNKTEVIKFSDFKDIEKDKNDFTFAYIDIRKQIKNISKHVMTVGALTIVFTDIAFAANTGIDSGARVIYQKLLSVGKWVIIIKGGVDTVNSVVQGDFANAKRAFMSYLVVYMILQGFPWAMDEVDKIFKNI